jgi:hypothetical protein
MAKKSGVKTCIRCGKTQPAQNFWASRPTCIECARALWYAPKCKANPKDSPYYDLVMWAVRVGLVAFPKDHKNE